MKNTFTFFLILFLSANTQIRAQQLVSYEFVRAYSIEEIEAVVDTVADNGASIYRVAYTMTDHLGLTDTVSGLVTIPDGMASSYPMVLYNHGTSNDAEDVPSFLGSGLSESLGYGGSGFIVLAPDYLGHGINSERFHPYVHAETEAGAGINLVFAGKEACDQLGIPYSDQLFVSGYSQGGHASMAAHRAIELEWAGDLQVTAAAHMSGPYDLSVTMRELILGDEEYVYAGFVVNAVLSMQEVYGNIYEELGDVFLPPYVGAIQNFKDGAIDLTQLSLSIGAGLFFRHGIVLPKLMFQDTMITNFENDPNHPLQRALELNDTYRWAPDAPTRLYYCTADDIVSFRNSVVAGDSMNARGAADLEAIDINPDLNHGDCAPPAILRSIEFFKSFVDPTPVTEIEPSADIILYPNPVSDILYLKNTDPMEIRRIELFDNHGRTVLSREGDRRQLQCGDLQAGTYWIRIHSRDGVVVQKLLKM